MSTLQKKSFLRRTLLANCDELGVGIWSCPSFIFLVMGVVIIFTILTTYVVAERQVEPEVVVSIVTLLTVFLLVITQVLVHAFEKVVQSKRLEAARTKEVLDLKDQFVYLAAHDLAAAATAVKWGLKMIEGEMNKTLSSDDQEIFASIRTRNEQLVALIHQILLITRIEREQIDLQLDTISLSAVLNDAVGKVWDENKRTSNMYDITIGEDLPSLTTDKTHFGTIIETLLANANAHSPQTGGKLAFSAETDGADTLLITVENNGEGIPTELQKHIFEKFWRDGNTGRIERAGFGLYIAQSLARTLGGNITFTSSPTVTRFTLRLPITPLPTSK